VIGGQVTTEVSSQAHRDARVFGSARLGTNAIWPVRRITRKIATTAGRARSAGVWQCATLYKRDRAGQADHAAKSPRPWAVRDAQVFAVGLYKRDLAGQADHARKSP
jgi:hypothetical protein